MDQSTALSVFVSLSSGIRLDAFRLLVRAGPTGAVAGEIASALEVAPSSLSFHLRTLTQSGLLTVEQEGRFQRYRADLSVINGVIDFLTENCCSGLPETCASIAEARSRVPACMPSRDPDPESHA
jgi:DNA-binding transcriptional ArsR family regulator